MEIPQCSSPLTAVLSLGSEPGGIDPRGAKLMFGMNSGASSSRFSASGSPAFYGLREGLRETGYVEGDNVKVEARWARGRPELLPHLTQELIQLRPAYSCRNGSSLDPGSAIGNDYDPDSCKRSRKRSRRQRLC